MTNVRIVSTGVHVVHLVKVGLVVQVAKPL